MRVCIERIRKAPNNIVWLPIATALTCTLLLISCSSNDGASTCSPANTHQGTYSGTWGTSTDSYGTWNANVDACGSVSGSGLSGTVPFTISGTADSSGNVTFGATQQDGTKTATFSGTIAADSSIQGTWTSVDGSASGTFSGSRQ